VDRRNLGICPRDRAVEAVADRDQLRVGDHPTPGKGHLRRQDRTHGGERQTPHPSKRKTTAVGMWKGAFLSKCGFLASSDRCSRIRNLVEGTNGGFGFVFLASGDPRAWIHNYARLEANIQRVIIKYQNNSPRINIILDLALYGDHLFRA
jgi:hypothetical protein